MDFGRAFSFPFEDQDWIRKIVITALISLIPILGWLYLAGWMIEILRRVLRQSATLLPEDINFGEFLLDGLKTWVISFVYSLPLMIFIVPAIVLPIVAGSNGDETLAGVSVFATCCCTGLGVLYGIFMGIILPAALGNFAATNELSAGFRFGEIFGLLKAAPGAYLMVFGGAIVVSLLASMASVIFLVGTLLVGTYGQAVLAHLYAQAYTEARRNRGFAQAY